MASIARLPDELIDKIAAGEVVERPASVVKELVENALDAGARSVLVEIEAGGKGLVRVRDDGSGMAPEDAARSVERHATSKLREMADLQRIASHGFRGEALSSIGSVSELRLLTREAAAGAGTEVAVRHGRLLHVREAGHPRGTTVEVRDLFGAVPARRKFLRADSTEASHVAEAVTLLALARPDVGFTLRAGGRASIETPPVAERGARLYQLFGAGVLERLCPVDAQHEWVRVTGFVTRAGRGGSARSHLRLFVNSRPVRDRGLARAHVEGYRRAGQSDPRGDSFLFVELPPHLLDVNVHPTKIEVRFADARVVFDAVAGAVAAALSREARGRLSDAAATRVAEAAERFLAGAGTGAPFGGERAGEHERAPAGARGAEAAGPGAGPRAGTPGPDAPRAGLAPAAPGLLQQAAPTVLGQHRNTYIVATDGEELLLFDQHTAHERARFERLLLGLDRNVAESQRLLVPAVVRLPPRLVPLLEEHGEALRGLGFEVEPFGAGTQRVGAVPAALGTRDPGPALQALLRELVERESAEWMVAGARERLAATLACHSSVKAGEPVAREQMAAIVAELWRTAHPSQCPHGRPTFVRIPREDVTRWFARAGWRRQ